MTLENGNFTPVFHLLAKEVGLVCAAVYGATWRHCQMKDNNCKASLDTLGDEIGVDRATVMRSIKKLCELGYLVDQTPGRRNAPHTYILGKSVAECNSLEVDSVAQDNSLGPTVAHSNATVAESHLKIDSKETPLRESKIESPKQKMFRALAELCRIDLSVASDKQMGLLGQTGGALAKKIQDIDQFKIKFSIYWTEVDWRGKKGQPPLPPQIREVYGDYCHWLENPAAYQKNGGSSNGATILERGKKEAAGLNPTSAALGAALLARARTGGGGT